MRVFDIMKGKHIIQQTAEQLGKHEWVVRAELQTLVDDYWERDTPEARRSRALLFPHGKPTPEEYIIVIARYAKKRVRNL
jgi:hypothetical protein